MLGNRIQRARKALGFSLRDLGEKISFSHAAIKKYEDNKVTPSSDVLIKLAQALHVKVEYFFRPERFILENIQYRKHTDMSKHQVEEMIAKILDQIERRIELEQVFPHPPIYSFAVCNLPKVIKDIEAIETLADDIRHQWQLGLSPLPDLIDLLEERGIKIFKIDSEQYPKMDGFYAEINKMPVIVVGNQRPGDRQRFTLAHELGHFLLDNRLASHLNIEKACNRFAGAFLLPKKSLISILGKHRHSIEPRELSVLKQEYGISMTAILHRAEEAGVISTSLYRQLRSEFNEHGWSKQEPGKPYLERKSHVFEQMVFHALAEDYIGESKAAELMNMSLESFRSFRMMENQHVDHQ